MPTDILALSLVGGWGNAEEQPERHEGDQHKEINVETALCKQPCFGPKARYPPRGLMAGWPLNSTGTPSIFHHTFKFGKNASLTAFYTPMIDVAVSHYNE